MVEEEVEETKPSERGEGFRTVAAWIAVVGGIVFVAVYTISTAYRGLTTELLQELVREHYLGVIAMPVMAIASLVIVVILGVTAGPIEFETPFNFKFKGASGPVIFWIFCFLAMVFGARHLW